MDRLYSTAAPRKKVAWKITLSMTVTFTTPPPDRPFTPSLVQMDSQDWPLVDITPVGFIAWHFLNLSSEEGYRESLAHALEEYMEGEERPFEEHCDRFELRERLPADEEAKRRAVMMMVTARTDLPMTARQDAKRYLQSRGLPSLDDGDVVV